MRVSFAVEGVHGQGRPRFTRSGRVYKAAADREWEAKVRSGYERAVGNAPLRPAEACLSVEIEVSGHLPQSRPKKVSSEPWLARPDADNIAKAVLDALNGVAWRDDAQVVRLVVVKRDRRRGDPDQTRVTIEDAPGYETEKIG